MRKKDETSWLLLYEKMTGELSPTFFFLFFLSWVQIAPIERTDGVEEAEKNDVVLFPFRRFPL